MTTTTLFSPTGDEYETGNVSEITRLKTRGYSEKRPTPTRVESATSEKAPAPAPSPRADA